MKMYKDLEKFMEELSHQSAKCQRKWSNPERIKKYFDSISGRSQPKGENSPRWIGDKICYISVHLYVRKIKPVPVACEKCGEPMTTKPYNDNSGRIRKSLDLCNINGTYDRDPNNYMWLCRRCHKKFDSERSNHVKNS